MFGMFVMLLNSSTVSSGGARDWSHGEAKLKGPMTNVGAH